MALINCPKCNHEISDTINKCIHCGQYINKKRNINIIFSKKIFLIFIITLILIGVCILGKNIMFDNNTSNSIDETTIPKEDTKNNHYNTDEPKDNNNSNSNNDTTLKDNEKNENDNNNNINSNKGDNNSNNKDNNNNNKDNVNSNSSSNNDNTESYEIYTYKSYAYSRKVCPKGYVFNVLCYKKTEVDAIIDKYTCSFGSTLVGTRCKTNVTMEPVNGECSISSYVLENDKCILYNDAKVEKHCPSGYKFESSIDEYANICSYTEYQEPQIEYYCAQGGVLDGEECIYTK